MAQSRWSEGMFNTCFYCSDPCSCLDLLKEKRGKIKWADCTALVVQLQQFSSSFMVWLKKKWKHNSFSKKGVPSVKLQCSLICLFRQWRPGRAKKKRHMVSQGAVGDLLTITFHVAAEPAHSHGRVACFVNTQMLLLLLMHIWIFMSLKGSIQRLIHYFSPFAFTV